MKYTASAKTENYSGLAS